jgi:hypothetical protein
VTNNSGIGSLTLGPLTATTGPSTINFSGVGKTILAGSTGWYSGSNTFALSAGAKLSLSNIAQVSASAVTIATQQGFANITTLEAASALDFSSKTVTVTAPANSNQRLLFRGTGNVNLNASPTLTSGNNNASLVLMNEGSGTISLTGATLGNGTNLAHITFGSGKFSFGSLGSSGTGTGNRFQVHGADVKFTGAVTAPANTVGILLREGKFTTDYTGNAAAKFANVNLFQTGGADVVFLGNDSAPVTETLGASLRLGSGSVVDGGNSNISVISGNGQNITVNLGAVSRGSSGTNFPTTSVGGGAATIGVTTTNTNGIFGGWATWNGTTYAINNGSDVMAGLADQ